MTKFVPFFVVFVFCSSAFGQAFKVTITAENAVVSILEVPQGGFLNAVASVDENPEQNKRLEMSLRDVAVHLDVVE